MKRLKNPTLFYLFLIFLLVNILDGITAFFIVKGESNPLFLFSGSMWILLLVKCGYLILVWWIYNKNVYPSHFFYFMMMLVMLMGTFVFSLGLYNNIRGILNPSIIATGLSSGEKLQVYTSFITAIYIVPFGLSLLGFKLYEWSLKDIKIEKQKQ